jgi:hypothetical protein
MTDQESAAAAATEGDRGLGRFLYKHAAIAPTVLFMAVSTITILGPQPRTAGELIFWLGVGVSVLSCWHRARGGPPKGVLARRRKTTVDARGRSRVGSPGTREINAETPG